MSKSFQAKPNYKTPSAPQQQEVHHHRSVCIWYVCAARLHTEGECWECTRCERSESADCQTDVCCTVKEEEDEEETSQPSLLQETMMEPNSRNISE